MIKLIVADCDGTILDSNKKIDSKLIQVIEDLKKRKVLFTLASGRNIYLMQDIIKELKLELPFIINNGANVYKQNKMIVNYALPNEYVDVICNSLVNDGFPFLAYSENRLVYNLNHSLLDGFKTKLNGKLTQIEYSKSINLTEYPVFKITVATDHQDDIIETKNKIEQLCPLINFNRSEGTLFTITNVNATKGNAIQTVADMLNIKMDEVMIFGDNYNDLSMFEKAGIGVAMGNSDKVIKTYATHSTKDNNHNGVSDFLIDYFNVEGI